VPASLLDSFDADTTGGEHEPRWLRALAFGSASAVAAFGAVALVAAVGGVYRSYVVFPIGAVAWIALLALARPILGAPGTVDWRAHLVAALGVVFVGAITYWNVRHASQHILINRDPGAYVNAGRWISLHGNLEVDAAVGPFATRPDLLFTSFGMYASGGVLSFQFAHLLSSLLALAHDVGGDRLMFAAGPVLGGGALLAFFVVAWRLLRQPVVALVALVAFGVLLPQISFSLDAFSEIPLQLLLFTALWILADRRSFRRPRVAFVAGLLLGMLQAARIDALVVLVGVAPLFAVMWLLADPRHRGAVARSAGACAVGIVPGVVLGYVDVRLRSHQYLTDLRGQVKALVAATIVSIVVAFVVVAIGPAVARRIRRVPDWLGWAAAAVVAIAGFGMWFVRPHVQHVRRGAGPQVEAGRTYVERSMTWLQWYLGPILLAAAIVAAALLVRALFRGRRWQAFALLALLGPAALGYLWRPNITTDQIWVMRRYLFSALPLFTLLGFGLVAALVRYRPRRVPRVLPIAVAVVIAAAGIVWPVRALKPVPNNTEQRTYPNALRDACRVTGDDAAIVVLKDASGPLALLADWVPQTLRSWCDVPVAVMAPTAESGAALAQLASSWTREGRRLWVVADADTAIRNVLPAARPQRTPVSVNPYLLERAVLHRPGAYNRQQFALVLAPVAPA
jgi:hypothetical protein